MKTVALLLLYLAVSFGGVWFSTWLVYAEPTEFGKPPFKLRVATAVFMFLFMVALDVIEQVGVGR